jgi:transcription antitermination factor NusG
MADPHQALDAPSSEGLDWFALKVRTKAEDSVRFSLQQKGYEAFVPTFIAVRKYSDRFKKITSPLFPGYVFCRLDRNRRLPVLMTPGVEYAVGFAGKLESIPTQEIKALEAVNESGLVVQPWPYLHAGDRVRIASGALAGVEGLLVRTQSADRLILSIEMLQRSISVEIERSWVRPILETPALKPIPSLQK